jgi:hypothetical protein
MDDFRAEGFVKAARGVLNAFPRIADCFAGDPRLHDLNRGRFLSGVFAWSVA